ncbi:Hypothetical predicted protein [Olea europaea subsp. europaea]|uniref:Uncharacterized protein n=1 Tax=Olea europaea subsp. europaea TaxID=158383 RepID=A0A8S0SQF2_OLEEU|nr:Hypothetical predicted protein [Olea europaea subsp. europaea]
MTYKIVPSTSSNEFNNRSQKTADAIGQDAVAILFALQQQIASDFYGDVHEANGGAHDACVVARRGQHHSGVSRRLDCLDTMTQLLARNTRMDRVLIS